ncbi:hypothetical protein [Streptomyces sp. NPDC057702]|uniref:hypothetical protein n=1 Tax=unclassified Streptomyces TaxID=2593676 RepID=UPI00368BE0E1
MPASALARALRTYVHHAPGTLGKARLVGRFLDRHPRTCPQAVCRPQPPVLCTEVSKDMTDLVFSRTDVERPTTGR